MNRVINERITADRDHFVLETGANGTQKILGGRLYSRYEADKLVFDKRYSTKRSAGWSLFGTKKDTGPSWSVHSITSLRHSAQKLQDSIMKQIEALKGQVTA